MGEEEKECLQKDCSVNKGVLHKTSEVCGDRGDEGLEIDTPEKMKNQIATPISKFQDSPVFNFLNSLSPIEPVKSVHTTQVFNPLNISTLPPVFTSPHISSVKGSRFLRRHLLSDPSKPEFSADNGSTANTDEETLDISYNRVERLENCDLERSGADASTSSCQCSQLPADLARGSQCPCSCPNSISNYSMIKRIADFPCFSEAQNSFSQERAEKVSLSSDMIAERVSQTERHDDTVGCDWQSLISDPTDLLVFDSPDGMKAVEKSVDPDPSSDTCTNERQNTEISFIVGSTEQLSEGHESDNPYSQPGEANPLNEFIETQARTDCCLHNSCAVEDPSGKNDNELASGLHRGIRRRCLVFEMTGTRIKHFDEKLSCGSSVLSQSDGSSPCGKRLAIPRKNATDSARNSLRGIGLHLNTLATTPKPYEVVKPADGSSSRRLLLIAPVSGANCQTSITGQESSIRSPGMTSLELIEDANGASGRIATEEFSQNSPKKKRLRMENGENESCKRCNCKKSKCLKLYCECFAAGVYCVEPCSCLECFNKPKHVDTVLATRKQIESRNPLAFAPKVIRTSDSPSEIGENSSKTPASARHKRGCNCKKSGCLKKYCECFQGGVGCSINCRCEGCKNAFGRKEGSGLLGSEAEVEEEETDKSAKSVVDGSLPKAVIQSDLEHNSAFPATPLQFGRKLMTIPFSSKSKPPLSSLRSIESSSGSCANQGIGKSSFLQHQSHYEKQFDAIQEDEIPEILQMNASPVSGVKSLSPNGKRVSPPHNDFGMSPNRRSRKLVLKSIPSFPSLADKH